MSDDHGFQCRGSLHEQMHIERDDDVAISRYVEGKGIDNREAACSCSGNVKLNHPEDEVWRKLSNFQEICSDDKSVEIVPENLEEPKLINKSPLDEKTENSNLNTGDPDQQYNEEQLLSEGQSKAQYLLVKTSEKAQHENTENPEGRSQDDESKNIEAFSNLACSQAQEQDAAGRLEGLGALHSSSKHSLTENSDEDDGTSFWKGMESGSEPLADWMTREKKGGANLQGEKLMELLPNFHPHLSKPVAGESVSDGAIANCNRGHRSRSKYSMAKEIWEFGKKIGAVACGNEAEIVKQIQHMEERDKNMMISTQVKNPAGEGKVH
ncbi:hypothetical protein SLEP1_g43431 [Rubroshorea leprosula]|uniref:Uncharacterized protein n=1 Tax=Rubroshorea leprosula TaxID=152421 RepID=A0AAV5LD99_9ROSI|nr:hypothetical protein SLEP1_g43431 [Rubroshorea leprosula]